MHAAATHLPRLDVCPRGSRPSTDRRRGMVGAALDDEFDLWAGKGYCVPSGPADDRPEVVGGFGFGPPEVGLESRVIAHEIDLCLSGPSTPMRPAVGDAAGPPVAEPRESLGEVFGGPSSDDGCGSL